MMNLAAKPPKYLVCVDKNTESRAALKLASAKASARGGMLNLVHIMEPPDFQTLGAVADLMRTEQLTEAETLMSQLSTEVFAMSGLTPGMILREGKIGDTIVQAAAEDPDATMLVLGVAEHTASRGKLTGWLASQLGTKIFIPLLLVPGNLTEEQIEALI